MRLVFLTTLLYAFPAVVFGGDATAPIVSDDVVFEEANGTLAVEAEHFYKQTLTGVRAWHITSSKTEPAVSPDADEAHVSGASGGAYVEALPDTRRTHQDKLVSGENFSNEPGKMAVLHYKVHFHTPGRYFAWARAYSTGAEDNGLHFGLDGNWPASGQRWQTVAKNRWHWDCKQRTQQVHTGVPLQLFLDIDQAGPHEILIAMREDGFELDRFVLTTRREDGRPQGLGPNVRVKSGKAPEPFPFVPAAAAVAPVEDAVNSALSAEIRRAPNIVFILADDLGYGDIKSFGGDRCQIATPHFDRLAREGMRFTDAHSNAAVCVPSRMAIMTGRYPWRFGPPAAGGPWGFLGARLPADQPTLGTMLHAAGYHTGYIGKWHLGTRMQTTDGQTQGPTNVDYRQPLTIGPPQYGFDESFILPGSLDMFPYAFVRDNQWVGQVTAEKGWSAFHRLGPAAEDFEDTKVLDAFSTEAERFIREHAAAAKQGRPFFLYLALTAPHTPVSPSAKFEGRSRLGIYGDFVMETDDCVGRVLAALDDQELGDDTLVIATSDHGPAPYAGRRREATFLQLKELEQEGHFSSGPFRGYKFSIYEGGLRVPFVARWPRVVPPRTTCDRLIALQDLMATLAEVTGTARAAHEAPDSISIVPLLKDPAAAPTRGSMAFESTRARAVRQGPWKLALCPGSGCDGRFGNSPAHEQSWRDAVAEFGRPPKSQEELQQAPFVQLFKLDDDPGETRNLAADHPEKVRDLIQLWAAQVAAGRTTPGPALRNDTTNIKLFSAVPPFVWRSTAEQPK